MLVTAPVPRRLGAALFGALAVALAAPAASLATPYEQVSRATGAQGASPLQPAQFVPKAVGDVGRYVGYARAPQYIDGYTQVEINDARNDTAWIRDVQTDESLDFGGGLRRVFGISRDEKWALLGRYRSGRSQIVLQPLPSGAPSVIEEFNGSVFVPSRAWPDALFSGDGQTVVISTEALAPPLSTGVGTYVKSWAAGSTPLRRVSNSPSFFLKNAISDDGKTFVADGDNGQTVYGPGFTRQLPLWNAVLSGNGRWAAWTEIPASSPPTAVVQDVTTGAKRSFPLPAIPNADGYFAVVNWIAPDGSSLTIAPADRANAAAKARRLNVATGAWTQLSPRFGRSLTGAQRTFDAQSRESVGGRFAAIGSGLNQVSLVDLTEAHIPGANEPLSVASYLSVLANTPYCDGPGKFAVQLMKPDFWAPVPASASVKLWQGSALLGSATLTQPLGPLAGPGQTIAQAPSGITRDYMPTGAALKLEATVTDAQGRVLTESFPVTPDSWDPCN